jgi:membrane associated rhomboid family serine protease
MDTPIMKAAAALIIVGMLLLLVYGFMTFVGDGGPGFMQWGAIGALIVGLALLWTGKNK